MAVNLIFDDNVSFVTVKGTGPVTITDLRKAYEELLNDPRFVKGVDVLWDITETKSKMPTLPQVRELQQWIKSRLPDRGTGYRAAMAVNQTFEYGLARLFEVYLDGMPLTFRAFRSRKQAIDWLTSDPEEK